jgi:hypothetical protein
VVQSRATTGASALGVAAVASIGAGAVHAAAMGAHAAQRQAVLCFLLTALAQIGWGVLTLQSERRWIVVIGAAMNAALVGGWVLAKTSGIGFVDGLDEAEPVQWADAVAAGFAALSSASAVWWLLRRRDVPRYPTAFRAVSLIVAIVTLTAMFDAASGHAHGGTQHDATTGHGHDGEAAHATVAPKPFDPAKPIDLGGTPGVTPQQQAGAENLVAATLLELPRWADPAAAEAQGWHSIGDGSAGHEHFLKPALMHDGRVLDPDAPESIVYEIDERTGERKLVAAMYMAEPGTTLATVPSVGGDLVQWHAHDNLCFEMGERPRFVGMVDSGEPCAPSTEKLFDVPMVHVWITPHRCGPFAIIGGFAAGQVTPGESVRCDTAHGDH